MKRVLVSIILFVCGLGIFLYPIITNYMNHYLYSTKVTNYEKIVSKLSLDEVSREFVKMNEYNQSLQGTTFHMEDPFSNNTKSSTYVQKINSTDGVLGSITIPKINEELPIYMGASEKNLSKGVGQIEGTSLPIGGESTHTVLAGHRGYQGATMFRYINKLQKGDEFYINILGKKLTYEVVGQEVIYPNDTEKLSITKGKDRATLLTCEPYTSSKYRLLIYGERKN
ncbi:class C sortase [Bacillus sp. CDB3]|uniref:class C sortase n=1 Tax=Bacillus sp. CDB3 TaxID=360310 RepID=UPI0009D7EEC8|nr:class C sortase [Bacillus sp. CDB3]OQR55781.1 class C sortase [Bacillus sp. CDB3]